MDENQEVEKEYTLKINGKIVNTINKKSVNSITIEGKTYKIKKGQ